MNKLYMILGAIVIVILAAAGYLYFTNPNENLQNNESSPSPQSTMTSIQELMGSNQNQMCTFSYSEQDAGTFEGTLYVANGKMRSNFSGSDGEGTTYNGSMIHTGEKIYTWSLELNQGVVMEPEEFRESQSETDSAGVANQQQYLDPQEQAEYMCSEWSVDQSKFIPPSDIEFMNIADQQQMMDQMMQNDADESTNESDTMNLEGQCTACENLPEDVAQACREQLGCN